MCSWNYECVNYYERKKKYRIRLWEGDLYRQVGFWGGIGIHRCDFCRRFRFRLFGEKKACKSMLVSGYTVAGDNKLSMKCFEINIFFFFFRLSFPLWYVWNRLFVFQLFYLYERTKIVRVFSPPFFVVKTLKNYDTLEIRRSIINTIARQNSFRIFCSLFLHKPPNHESRFLIRIRDFDFHLTKLKYILVNKLKIIFFNLAKFE